MSVLQAVQAEQAGSPAFLPAPEADDALRALMRGALAEKLGLTSEQLGVGLTLARNHLARGAYPEALQIYVGLVLCQPANDEFQIGLANCASLMGEHHLAIQAASAVIALSPTNPRGYLLSGRSCLAIGALDEAREDLSDALRFAQANHDGVAAAEAGKLLAGLSAMVPA